MSRYLITGGCGFIGSHLVRYTTDAGHEVVVLDNLSTGQRSNVPPGVPVVVADVCDSEAVQNAVSQCDGVFHLAAVSSVEECTKSWLSSHVANVLGTVTVLEAARTAGRIPVVYASSAAVYGESAEWPHRETQRPNPISSYGSDKVSCELNAKVAGATYEVPSFGLRLFNIYGGNHIDSWQSKGVISNFAQSIGKDTHIFIDGDGEQTRDFVHIDDLPNFFFKAMELAHTAAPIVNVSTGRGIKIRELAMMMCEMTRSEVGMIFREPRPNDICASVGCPDLATYILGVRASISLEEGLPLTLAMPSQDKDMQVACAENGGPIIPQ